MGRPRPLVAGAVFGRDRDPGSSRGRGLARRQPRGTAAGRAAEPRRRARPPRCARRLPRIPRTGIGHGPLPRRPAPHARLQPAGGRSRRCARAVMGRRRAARDAHRSGHAHDRARRPRRRDDSADRGLAAGVPCSGSDGRQPGLDGRMDRAAGVLDRTAPPKTTARSSATTARTGTPRSRSSMRRHPSPPQASRFAITRSPHRRTGASERTPRASPGAGDGCATPRTA